MKQILLGRYGEPHEVARCVDVPDVGAPGAGEVVFDVLAFPINPADLWSSRGHHRLEPPLPATPGAECVVRVPQGLPLPQAAMLRINPPTALLMLTDLVAPEPGQWLVQDVANSAVGRCGRCLPWQDRRPISRHAARGSLRPYPSVPSTAYVPGTHCRIWSGTVRM